MNVVVKESEKACCSGYQLVLMDLNMPVMGGIEAAQEIIKLKRASKLNPYLEIVAVTAFVSDKEKEK